MNGSNIYHEKINIRVPTTVQWWITSNTAEIPLTETENSIENILKMYELNSTTIIRNLGRYRNELFTIKSNMQMVKTGGINFTVSQYN